MKKITIMQGLTGMSCKFNLKTGILRIYRYKSKKCFVTLKAGKGEIFQMINLIDRLKELAPEEIYYNHFGEKIINYEKK